MEGRIKYCGKKSCGHAHAPSQVVVAGADDDQGNPTFESVGKECARCGCKKFEPAK